MGQNSPEITARRAAATFKEKCAACGSTITIMGHDCKAFPAPIERGDASYVPDGTTGNASFPDLRAYMIVPNELSDAPRPGQTVVDEGVRYTVTAAPPPQRLADVAIYQKFFAFREAPADGATDVIGPDGASTGKRPVYAPPPSTL